MIKWNGDWTQKFIDTLVECKKKMLKVKKLGGDQNDIFNVLLDLDSQLEVKERCKQVFPKIHISRPITSAAEAALYWKNFIMIGAGSGIAPYLSFIEDASYFVEKVCWIG